MSKNNFISYTRLHNVLGIVLSLLILLSFAIVSPTPIIAEEILKPSDINAIGAILVDADSGRVLWEKNSRKPLPMASTTKIMTAIIALEYGNLDDTVVVSNSVSAVPKVKLNLSPGEKIKLKYLMYALMLESSNDAAVAIAEHIAGTVHNFCQLMNQKAKQIGTVDTIFETPNGLDKGLHHSTAYDLALISRYALLNPKFLSLINTPSATFSSDKQTYTVNNKNRLLRDFPGANGIKTGFTAKAGHCFVGAAKKNNMQLISVVLASGWGPNGKLAKWSDTKKILNYGFNNFHYKNIISKNSVALSINVSRSRTKSLNLLYQNNLSLPISDSEENQIYSKIFAPHSLIAPVKKNDVIGYAQISVGNDLININLLADKSATRHDFITSLHKILNQWLNPYTIIK